MRMKNKYWIVASMFGLLVSCGGDDSYTISDLALVGEDACEMAQDFELGTMNITIDGSNVTLDYLDEDGDLTELSASTDSYVETDNTIVLEGGLEDSTTEPPCIAELQDTFTINLTDELGRLDTNDTLDVEWVHTETDISDGACNDTDPDLWFVPLPCTSTLTFTLTKGSIL